MLKITSLNFRPVPFESDTIMAFLTIELCESIKVHNMKVIKSTKEEGPDFWVAYPSRKGSDDNYYNTVRPTSKAVRSQISKLIISEFKKWAADKVEKEEPEKVEVKLSEDL